MASYTTRIELHGASYQDYDALHAAMAREGFSRTIVSDDGRRYQLPTAEYDRRDGLTRNEVLESAKRAASTTRRNFGVIVTEAQGRLWEGLPQV